MVCKEACDEKRKDWWDRPLLVAALRKRLWRFGWVMGGLLISRTMARNCVDIVGLHLVVGCGDMNTKKRSKCAND